MSDCYFLICLVEDDDDFIFGLVLCFVDFILFVWCKWYECIEGICVDLVYYLDDQLLNSFLFVVEDEDGELVGFLYLQKIQDFFNGCIYCYIFDLVVVLGYEGQGVGWVLLVYVEDWVCEYCCVLMMLVVFLGNEWVWVLYEVSGYDIDLLCLVKLLC